MRSLHGPKWAQASSPAESKADPDHREGHNAWPSGAGRLCQNKGLARTGTGPHPGSWDRKKEPMKDAWQGCGKRSLGHSTLNPSTVTFSMRLLIADWAGVPPHSGTAPTACSRGTMAGLGGNRLEERDALRPVPEGLLPACRGWIRSAAGCEASAPPGEIRVPSPLHPGRGFREGPSGGGRRMPPPRAVRLRGCRFGLMPRPSPSSPPPVPRPGSPRNG